MLINYGMGNIRSVGNALTRLSASYFVSSDKDDLAKADAYILPGVGAFSHAMANIAARGLFGPLTHEVMEKKKPFLGICLGMQLMAEDSMEKGFHKGFGWLPGHVRKLDAHNGLRIPHVGWNELEIRNENQLFTNVPPDANFYFDHSYALCEADENMVAALCDYGAPFVAALRKGNLFGTQFHPEKSHVQGLRVFRNFLNFVEYGTGNANA
ncbi:MAG: imidazole glycerol phosphate synthase, glutamine amidotransferase subunit [Lentisphaerae bacterium GWF2_52_8]|nr:MAG: imidazole glycerol phosphate synthase, glutamine amidotransferase subunit [Lentisphaerae bacterium GWF2_52_8]